MSRKNASQRTPGEGARSREPVWPGVVGLALWFGAVGYFLRETAALARQLARQREALGQEVVEEVDRLDRELRLPGAGCAPHA
jgi:hypothetical protein